MSEGVSQSGQAADSAERGSDDRALPTVFGEPQNSQGVAKGSNGSRSPVDIGTVTVDMGAQPDGSPSVLATSGVSIAVAPSPSGDAASGREGDSYVRPLGDSAGSLGSGVGAGNLSDVSVATGFGGPPAAAQEAQAGENSPHATDVTDLTQLGSSPMKSGRFQSGNPAVPGGIYSTSGSSSSSSSLNAPPFSSHPDAGGVFPSQYGSNGAPSLGDGSSATSATSFQFAAQTTGVALPRGTSFGAAPSGGATMVPRPGGDTASSATATPPRIPPLASLPSGGGRAHLYHAGSPVNETDRNSKYFAEKYIATRSAALRGHPDGGVGTPRSFLHFGFSKLESPW